MTSRLITLWNGDIKLWKSFWIFGIAIPLLLPFIAIFPQKIIASIFWKYPTILLVFAALTVIAIFFYGIFIGVTIWRSANKYQGKRIWAYLAKLIGTAFLLLVLYSNLDQVYTLFTLGTNSVDREKTSHNIQVFLKPDKDYPLIGFWKENCNDDFGLAIDKEVDERYSVLFCGPGGCDKPSSQNTRSRDALGLQVINDDTIKIKGQLGFSTYYRCK